MGNFENKKKTFELLESGKGEMLHIRYQNA
jgi:hypothetical protein